MRRLFLPALLLTALAVPVAAHASALTVLNDCNDDEQLSKVYTQKEYKAALNLLPADDDQYTGCRDIIQRAMIAAAARGSKGGSGSGGTGGGTGSDGGGGATGGLGVGNTAVPTPVGTSPLTAASPADQAAAVQAESKGDTPVEVAGATITPGNPGTLVSSLDELPTPLLILLGVLAVAALVAAGLFVKSRVVGGSA